MFAQLLIIIQLLPFCLASYIADFHWLHGYHYIPMTQNRRNFLAAPEGEDSKFSDAIPLQPPAYRVTKSHEVSDATSLPVDSTSTTDAHESISIVPLAESDASAPEVISETVSASLIIAPSRDKITKSITDNNDKQKNNEMIKRRVTKMAVAPSNAPEVQKPYEAATSSYSEQIQKPYEAEGEQYARNKKQINHN